MGLFRNRFRLGQFFAGMFLGPDVAKHQRAQSRCERNRQRETDSRVLVHANVPPDGRPMCPVGGRHFEHERPPGTLIQPGEPLATIVPSGEPRAVAHFPPVVIGRIQPGQRARLRLAGFPWTQYGTVPATVASCAQGSKARRRG